MWLVSIVIYIYVIFYYTNMVYALHVILHIHARSDNNIVRTLSNFHSPVVVEKGLKRKKKVNKVREQHRSDVDCPEQNFYYSTTFHLIDKGNMNEAKYDISFESKKHRWSPKLAMRLFNMNLNNAYKIYKWLVDEYTPGHKFLTMGGAVNEGAHALL